MSFLSSWPCLGPLSEGSEAVWIHECQWQSLQKLCVSKADRGEFPVISAKALPPALRATSLKEGGKGRIIIFTIQEVKLQEKTARVGGSCGLCFFDGGPIEAAVAPGQNQNFFLEFFRHGAFFHAPAPVAA